MYRYSILMKPRTRPNHFYGSLEQNIVIISRECPHEFKRPFGHNWFTPPVVY